MSAPTDPPSSSDPGSSAPTEGPTARAPGAAARPTPAGSSDAPHGEPAGSRDAGPGRATAAPPETRDAGSGLRQILVGVGLLVALVVAFLIVGPHVGFLRDTVQKVRQGDPLWLVLAVALEVASFAGYVWVLTSTVRRSGLVLPRVTSWRITLAGVAATRVIATAGAGGIAATTFALRRQGLEARAAAAAVAAQVALTYVWFVLLILVTGVLLFLLGHAHAAVTIVPAGAALVVLAVAGGGRPVLHRLAAVTAEREGRVAEAVAFLPQALDDAVRYVGNLVRTRDLAIAGGALWWLADAGVLWAACEAFGANPNLLDVLMAYLLGQVANLLPIPGGLGVEAGLTGALIAFGLPAGVAVLAGITQRLISTWLPAVPGALALAAIGKVSPDAQTVDPPGPTDGPGSASGGAPVS